MAIAPEKPEEKLQLAIDIQPKPEQSPFVLILWQPSGQEDFLCASRKVIFYRTDETGKKKLATASLRRGVHRVERWRFQGIAEDPFCQKLMNGEQDKWGSTIVEPRQLLKVADSGNIFSGLVPGLQGQLGIGIGTHELVKRTYSTDLLNDWLMWLKDQKDWEARKNDIKAVQEQIDRLTEGKIKLPTLSQEWPSTMGEGGRMPNL